MTNSAKFSQTLEINHIILGGKIGRKTLGCSLNFWKDTVDLM